MEKFDKAAIIKVLDRVKQGDVQDNDMRFLSDTCRALLDDVERLQEIHDKSFWIDKAISLVKALSEISSLQRDDAIAYAAIENLTRFWSMESGALLTLDDDRREMVLCATYGHIDWDSLLASDEVSTPANWFGNDLEQSPLVFQGFGDTGMTEAESNFIRKNRIKTLVILPMITDGEISGLIFLGDTKKEHTLTEQQMALGGLFANQAAILIERTKHYKATQKQAAELQALHQVSLSLTASLDLQKVLDTILESTLNMLEDAQDAHIFLYDGSELSFGAVLWEDGNKEKIWAQPRKDGLTYMVARSGNLIYINDMQHHKLFKNVPSDWKGSIIGMPLKIGRRVVGVMTVAHPDVNAFTKDEIHVLRLIGDQAAIAIENARLHNLVNQQAHTDSLTRLPNRRSLDEHLRDEIRRSKRYKHSFSIVMLDLDRFKRVNDTFGHPTGDIVLRQIAQKMLSAIRETDFLARYGGDEFTLLLPETDYSTAVLLSKRLKDTVAEYWTENSLVGTIQLGLSVGIATYPRDGETAEELLAAADDKLYQDKNLG